MRDNVEIESRGYEARQTSGADRAANLLRALANPHRLMILQLLDQAPHNVMELCERLHLRQSLASQHLARLRLDGIVNAERQGHHVIYSLRGGMAREVLLLVAKIMGPLVGIEAPAKKGGRTNGTPNTYKRGARR